VSPAQLLILVSPTVCGRMQLCVRHAWRLYRCGCRHLGACAL